MSKERSIVGDLINFRGLVYSPLNENGVVFLCRLKAAMKAGEPTSYFSGGTEPGGEEGLSESDDDAQSRN